MSVMKWLWRWAWAALLGLGTVGCGVDSGDTSSGGAGGGGPACDDDPKEAEEPVLPGCGIWVSASKGIDSNPGTQDAPLASLQTALERALLKQLRHVYACSEKWTEPVVMPDGVSLHGGFDCQAEWNHGGFSEIETAPGQIPVTVTGGLYDKSFLTDFVVRAGDAAEPGGYSIAVFVRDPGVYFTAMRCELVAGDGADGADGAPGDPDDLPASDGVPGNPGVDACSGPLVGGGVRPFSACDSFGGVGGDSGVMLAQNGEDGGPPYTFSGAGGLGQENTVQCSGGQMGGDGGEGTFGLGGKGKPTIAVDGPVGRSCEDGEPGQPGQGGGGGGATFGSMAVCGPVSAAGASGGSGGSGGCGGKGGQGGQAGGAGVPVVSRSSGLRVRSSVLRPGKAGNGGNGGPPQVGGIGAPGAPGGSGVGTIKSACPGGLGGDGGKGGWGGGGAAGRSPCVAVPAPPDPNEKPDPDILEQTLCHPVAAAQPGLGDPAEGEDVVGEGGLDPSAANIEGW